MELYLGKRQTRQVVASASYVFLISSDIAASALEAFSLPNSLAVLADTLKVRGFIALSLQAAYPNAIIVEQVQC